MASELIIASDFMGGFAHALVLKGRKTILNNEKFHENVAIAFESFRQEAKARGISTDFLIRPSPIHGYSEIVDTGLCHWLQNGLATMEDFRNRAYRLHGDKDRAESLLGHYTGGQALYMKLAEHFLAAEAQISHSH